jgi:hypothetical protein
MQAQSNAEVVIRYTYPGTTNGQPVGDVYVTGPHFGGDIWSHTYRVSEAAKFTAEDAARKLVEKSWRRNGGRAVPVEEAEDLPGRFPR